MLGFNFYRKSVRYVEVGMCRSITSALRTRSHARLVGVFVNSSVAEIRATTGTCGLHFAQLHGDETPEMLEALNGKAFNAIRLSTDSVTDSRTVTDFAELRQGVAPVLLIDAAVKGVYGGSGVTADWSSAAELAKKVPLLLAGGLTRRGILPGLRHG